MELLTFPHYRAYCKAQRRSDKAKTDRCQAKLDEITKIVDWLMDERNQRDGSFFAGKHNGMCHGCRTGEEVDLFAKEFKLCDFEMIGTDLFQRENSKVIKWDMQEPNPEWIGKFDFVYSNALDHSYKPRECLRIWLEQLNDNGVLLLQWSASHITTQGGDCFGAALHEYVALVQEVGKCLDLLYHGNSVFTVIGSKGEGWVK